MSIRIERALSNVNERVREAWPHPGTDLRKVLMKVEPKNQQQRTGTSMVVMERKIWGNTLNLAFCQQGGKSTKQ